MAAVGEDSDHATNSPRRVSNRNPSKRFDVVPSEEEQYEQVLALPRNDDLNYEIC
ncbi:hypothetical protein [Mesorhizobium sp. Cs1321R2N1]|uniref:hypothetical protein n=1 Tax=Mesorhizobium sp. Cs1321R2N1 TaxID=3015174 RepID=UPI00301E4251